MTSLSHLGIRSKPARRRRAGASWAVMAVLTFCALRSNRAAETSSLDLTGYQAKADQIIQAALASDFAFQRLARLCDTFGPRLSGSTNLEAAIDWVLGQMTQDGFEQVHGEPVQVPHWVRGKEALQMLEPRPHELAVLGLGGSVGTPPGGLSAEVLVVRDFAELRRLADRAKGKIVLFNLPFTSYRDTVIIRSQGAIEAGKAGAVASLIRSVTPMSLRTPHTGMLRYDAGVPPIPHAAITVEDAELLQRFQDRGQRVVLRLELGARTLPDAPSRNVIAELKGRERPDEIVLVSGHLDSWDVGQGAMDDGGGCLAAWEAVRLLRKLDLRPRRTIRVVLWTNEENGLRGSRVYWTAHRAQLAQHLLAIESDEGVFQPTGFAFSGSSQATAWIGQIAAMLGPIQATSVTPDAGGADLAAAHDEAVPIMDLRVQGEKYFWYHHTSADTIDKLNAPDFNRCVAALAVMSYVVADVPGRLPR